MVRGGKKDGSQTEWWSADCLADLVAWFPMPLSPLHFHKCTAGGSECLNELQQTNPREGQHSWRVMLFKLHGLKWDSYFWHTRTPRLPGWCPPPTLLPDGSVIALACQVPVPQLPTLSTETSGTHSLSSENLLDSPPLTWLFPALRALTLLSCPLRMLVYFSPLTWWLFPFHSSVPLPLRWNKCPSCSSLLFPERIVTICFFITSPLITLLCTTILFTWIIAIVS